MPPTEATETQTTKIGEYAGANIVMGEPKRERMGILQWVGVVGMGTVLIVWLVPKIWDQQVKLTEKMLENAEKQSTAMQKTADAIDDIGESFKDGVTDIKDNNAAIVERLEEFHNSQLRKLERIADAVEAKHESPQPTEAEGGL